MHCHQQRHHQWTLDDAAAPATATLTVHRVWGSVGLLGTSPLHSFARYIVYPPPPGSLPGQGGKGVCRLFTLLSATLLDGLLLLAQSNLSGSYIRSFACVLLHLDLLFLAR
jgi:hypothetical protein